MPTSPLMNASINQACTRVLWKRRSALFICAFGLLLTSCASSYEQVGMTHYQPEYRITCADNPLSHIADCRERAQELCPTGYTELTDGEVGRGDLSSLWTISKHELLISCN